MTPLWTSTDAVRATGGATSRNWQASGVSIDTRSIKPGDLFIALTDIRDGHDFVAQALEKGAAAALVSRIPADVADDAPLLMVDDVQQALEALGQFARVRTNARVVGVTGSVGKTSTKEMLRAVLAGQGRVHAAERSFNNQWGVPLTLARMPEDTEFAIIEIGMNHPGEIAPLAKMARPHVALITNVAPAHLAAFENLQGIAQEKSAIFEGLEQGGTAIINADLLVTDYLLGKAGVAGAASVLFGEFKGADFGLNHVQMVDDTTIVRAMHGGTPILFKIRSAGRHFAMNALGCLAVADVLGVDLAVAACDLAAWQPSAGRGIRETIVLDIVDDHLTFDLLDDAYNANPASLGAAIEVLAASKPTDGVGRVSRGRKIAVLGDMLELGPDEIQLHRDIANYIGMDQISLVHCVGPMMRSLYDDLPANMRGEWYETAQEMAVRVYAIVDAGDVVLVKGSLGSKVGLIVDAIRKLGHPQTPEKQGTD